MICGQTSTISHGLTVRALSQMIELRNVFPKNDTFVSWKANIPMYVFMKKNTGRRLADTIDDDGFATSSVSYNGNPRFS